MMKSYTAYCMNEDGENLCMTREYEAKKHFIDDLHGNGYKVHFVALTEKYDEESQKYNERRIAKNRAAKIRRDNAKAWAKRREERRAEIEARYEAEETTTEENKEEKTMTASREFFTLEERARKADNHINIVADSDTEYEVKNAPTSEAAVKLAMEKYAKKLETIGTPAAELLARTVRDYIRFEYFSAANGYNYSGKGGGAFEISVNHLDDTTTTVYLRVAEILEEGEEPEEEPTEEEQTAEEQPEEVPSFESVKNQLFAKVEHIENSTKPEGFKKFHGTLWAREGQDLAVTVWNGSERVTRETADAWEESTGLTLREIINEAIKNTMATQKPEHF